MEERLILRVRAPSAFLHRNCHISDNEHTKVVELRRDAEWIDQLLKGTLALFLHGRL